MVYSTQNSRSLVLRNFWPHWVVFIRFALFIATHQLRALLCLNHEHFSALLEKESCLWMNTVFFFNLVDFYWRDFDLGDFGMRGSDLRDFHLGDVDVLPNYPSNFVNEHWDDHLHFWMK